MKNKLTAQVFRTKEPSKEYGHITELILPDKSKIYIHKKGWELVIPRKSGKELARLVEKLKTTGKFETILPWNEIELALTESEKVLKLNNKHKHKVNVK
jgi:hypothetical protein